MAKVIPVLIIFIITFAVFKRINIYKSFTAGVGEARDFILSLIPTLCAVFMMCELMESSGITAFLTKALSPMLSFLGIPKELARLILIKPFSGSGSLTFLTDIINTYGADHYISRCACVLYGSSETVFYISAVYFAKVKVKGIALPVIIVLFCFLLSAIIACMICKVL